MSVTVWVHEYVCGCYLHHRLMLRVMVSIVTLLLNESLTHLCLHTHHHRHPPLQPQIYTSNTTQTYTTVVLLSSSLSNCLPLSHTTHPPHPYSPPHPPPPPTHLFCTSLMVIFSEFGELLWMHVFHVHVVMHIEMLKWCIWCYISCGLT